MHKVKLFTLIIIAMTLVFLITGPKYIQKIKEDDDPSDFSPEEKPRWTGIINLWDISFVTSGTGSHSKWLYSYIRAFEKENPGVYIKVRHLTADRLKLYLGAEKNSDFLPDIISVDPYRKYVKTEFLTDISGCLNEKEIEKLHPVAKGFVLEKEKLTCIPFMMGSYGFVINLSLINENNLNIDEYINDGLLTLDSLDNLVRKMSYQKKAGKKVTDYYGFNTYSTEFAKPILSMIYNQSGTINNRAYNILMDWAKEQNLVYGNFGNVLYADSLNHFTAFKRSAVMLGGSNIIYTIRRLEDSGRGFDFAVAPISVDNSDKLFMDQVGAYGLFKTDSENKKDTCLKFLKGMLEEEHQLKLNEIGMFSVIKDINDIYADDQWMSVLEKSLNNFYAGPFDYNEEDLSNLLYSLKNVDKLE